MKVDGVRGSEIKCEIFFSLRCWEQVKVEEDDGKDNEWRSRL